MILEYLFFLKNNKFPINYFIKNQSSRYASSQKRYAMMHLNSKNFVDVWKSSYLVGALDTILRSDVHCILIEDQSVRFLWNKLQTFYFIRNWFVICPKCVLNAGFWRAYLVLRMYWLDFTDWDIRFALIFKKKDLRNTEKSTRMKSLLELLWYFFSRC